MSAARGEQIAIVVEEAGENGGTERVSAFAAEQFPGARIVTLRTANRRRHFSGPLLARRFAELDVGPADLLLTFPTSGAALATTPPPGAAHVAFLPGPPRALHGHVGRYLRDYPAPFRPALALAVPALRSYAARLVRRPDRLLTYSTAGAAAIERLYGRRVDVVPPPIRTAFFTPGPGERTHFVTVARLVAHKRIDVVVEAFRGVDAELVVVGHGACLERLRSKAPRNVRFAGVVSDDRLRELYRGAIAFVSPAPEEFGMAMVEAQACGTPVIAPRAGGALDIVRDGETGVLLDQADARSIAHAVGRIAATDAISSDRCRASAERFRAERFAVTISRIVDDVLASLNRQRRAALPRSAAVDLAATPISPR